MGVLGRILFNLGFVMLRNVKIFEWYELLVCDGMIGYVCDFYFDD